MSIEPHARRRLQLVYETTRDAQLIRELRQVLEAAQMSFVPSADVLRAIAMCAACTQDAPRTGRARWNLEACMADMSAGADQEVSLQRLVDGVLSTGDGAQLLSAFDRQRRALQMVMEAHARGAVQLPDSIAATVERACTSGPRFLTGGSSNSVVQQAS